MRIIITGSAGFIGSALTKCLLDRGEEVIGIDNHNDYYDPKLKDDRIDQFLNHPNYTHIRSDIKNSTELNKIFSSFMPEYVVNLAAQAGVRYSIENPTPYSDSNLVGFMNILEACRHNNVKHLVYGSSSSVYGSNSKLPFSESDSVNHPSSFYAATKKANELMAHSYSHLFNLPTSGLRFFTVYGPWDRPDMALQKFAQAITENKSIKLYNNGEHKRDFTYIDDIVNGIICTLDSPPKKNLEWDSGSPNPGTSAAPWRIFNIGSGNPISLQYYVELIEKNIGISAKRELLPLQSGDLIETFADIAAIKKQVGYVPKTTIETGIKKSIEWFVDYYNPKAYKV